MVHSEQVSGDGTKQLADATRTLARRVLALMLGCLGLLAFAGNILLLAQRIFLDDSLPWHVVPLRFKIWEVEFRAVPMFVGFAWILAASLIDQRRIKSGCAIAIIALILLPLNRPTNLVLRHHFAGDSYRLQGDPIKAAREAEIGRRAP